VILGGSDEADTRNWPFGCVATILGYWFGEQAP
jgi:hypothetical protein